MTNPQIINGVRLDVVARLVGNQEDVTATPRERDVAAKVRQVGERLERKGVLPELRRRQMVRAMVLQAKLAPERKLNDGHREHQAVVGIRGPIGD